MLASAVCSNLLATGVRIPTKLRGTAAGQRVVDIYKGLVGRDVHFIVEKSGDVDEFVNYTGTIKAVVLPDIRDFITNTSGDQDAVQLKLVMEEVQAEDPQADEGVIPKLIETKNSELNSLGFHFASLKEVDTGTLGEKIRWVRLLARHEERDDIIGEVLVEMESDGDMHTEIEPFIAKLPSSALPEVFLKAFPDGFMGLHGASVAFPDRFTGLSLEGALLSSHFFTNSSKE